MSAPLRIIRPDSSSGLRSSVSEKEEGLKSYLERLVKMIPGEVVGFYLIGRGEIADNQAVELVIWALIGLVAVIVVKAWGTSDKANDVQPDWIHVTISSIAFVIWTYTLGGPFLAYGIYVPSIGSLLVLTWTFFIPIFYKGPFDKYK